MSYKHLWKHTLDRYSMYKSITLLNHWRMYTRISPFYTRTSMLASFPGLPPLFCITGLGASGGKPGNEATSMQ